MWYKGCLGQILNLRLNHFELGPSLVLCDLKPKHTVFGFLIWDLGFRVRICVWDAQFRVRI